MTFIGTNIRIKLLNRYCISRYNSQIMAPIFSVFWFFAKNIEFKGIFCKKTKSRCNDGKKSSMVLISALGERGHRFSRSFTLRLLLSLILSTSTYSTIYILQKSRRDESFLGRGLNNLSLGHSPEHLCGTVRNTELRIVLWAIFCCVEPPETNWP